MRRNQIITTPIGQAKVLELTTVDGLPAIKVQMLLCGSKMTWFEAECEP